MTRPASQRASGSRSASEYADLAPHFSALARLPAGSRERTAARDEIVGRTLPLAEHLARRFLGRGETYDDLVQVARIGLLHAVDRFDPSRGSDFVAFAVPTIMGELRRHFRDAGWALRVPRRMKELHLAISGAVGDLSQVLGRAPTVSELAAALGLPKEDVAEGIVAGNAYRTVPVDSASAPVMGVVASLGFDDAALAQVDDAETLRPALAALSERDRTVLALRFVDGLTQTQIAARVGISQMHVSRVLARTLAQLRADLGER